MQIHKPPQGADLGQAMSQLEFANIIDECINQPPWRRQADIESDYVDGNQLDSTLLQKLKAIGIPPAKENIIGPAIAAVCGYEAKTRTDWRVTPDGDPGGQDVADALNFRLNQAERHSKADEAMSDAFRPQASVGLGWVEVARNSDPFGFHSRCRYVSRNEMWWDMRARERDLSDARWLLRERYIGKEQAAAAFPDHAELIRQAESVSGLNGYGAHITGGGLSTGLQSSASSERAWTTREQAWYRSESDEVCISEVWYRRWVSTIILRLKGGRVVEFDMASATHQAAVASGQGILERATVTRVRRAYWMGPVCLVDEATPYPHRHFPYVPFWGYREDMTGIPFGLVRDMIYPQDNLNSTQAKLRWGMAATRTERTKGAVAMTDEQFRRQVSRPDADIVLDADHFRNNPGARFEVKRDFTLNNQQFQLMADSRAALERVSPVTPSFTGRTGTATSGVQEQTQVEQSHITLADMMDNFKASRAQVGELLLAMEIEAMGEDEQAIVIEGDVLNPPRTVVVNRPEVDPDTGMRYRSNDILRTRLKVALEDVPSTSSFRAQQLNSLSESIKGANDAIKETAMPFMIDLMDMPRKKEFVEALRNNQKRADPEAIREQVKQELMHDLKERELILREREVAAKEKLLGAQQVQTGVQASYSAMQAAAQVAEMPQIAPIADIVMQGAGYQKPNPAGDDPNFPQPQMPATTQQPSEGLDVQHNTSPSFPPVPQQPGSGMTGIETPGTADNIAGAEV